MADKEAPKSNPVNDLWWILAVFIGFGLLWFVGGGASATNSNNGSRNNSYFGDDSTEEESRPKNTIEIAEDIKDVEDDLEDIEEQIQDLLEKSKRSPLYGKMSISASGNDDNLSEEYVRIRVSSSFEDKFPITGLTLYSPITGKSAVIGAAVEIPRIGRTNQEVAVFASPGDTIYVLSGSSPIGMSFRTNLCTGYLSQYQKFEPRLDKNCPTGDDEAEYLQVESALGPACLENLDDLPRCEVPQESKLSSETNCKNFALSNLNYNACVANHFGDTEFPGDEWRIYLRATNQLWRNDNDIVELLDSNGKVIDAVSI